MKLKFYQSLFLIVALGFVFYQTGAAQAIDELGYQNYREQIEERRENL